ncbi:hypothetical protein BJ138DRAFT_1084054 [Hygrophoropsis aurantiaca]|uniref:Uncharacterized protein n=1 Tax=Hygrophoropsis aurantiaca TaxID=72124 RepID=A0ACB8AG03_9AGAM|nr:hypothetical protein BJ138DRAFT_1084054 [Hygrophoropsis aurantiaca]
MEEHAEPFASSSRAQAVSTHPVASAGSSQQKESLVLESQPGTEAEIPSLADDHGGHLPKKTFVTTKDWTLQNLVECAPHFRCIPRVSLQDPNLYKTIDYHEKEGIPLIIEGWQNHHKWPKDMFTLEWLREHGDQNAYARNIHTWTDLKLSLPDLIDRLRASAPFSAPDEKERLYGKDGECPQIWRDWLSKGQVIPSRFLFGAEDDLLQHLPDANKVETLMCYLGVGDTFTPFHKDLCASSGQNLMCYTENSGSSFWFMTRGSAAPKVANYFHQLGQELDLESHVVTVEEFKKAPFDVYIGEQVLGDLVLVPPRSCHQVINHGGITVKTSWSRMTLNGLKTALYHELPIYRRVCRPEIYRVKSNIYHALLHYTARLNNLVAFASTLDHVSSSSRAPSTTDDNDQRVIARKLRELLQLFDDIAIQEYTPIYSRLPHVSQLGSHKDDINCDFCGADVFQSFFECRDCAKGVDPENINRTMNPGDGVVICAACYVEGRTCLCGIMKPTQCRSFKDLLQDRDKAVKALESSRVETDQEYIYLAKHKRCGRNQILITLLMVDLQSDPFPGKPVNEYLPCRMRLTTNTLLFERCDCCPFHLPHLPC